MNARATSLLPPTPYPVKTVRAKEQRHYCSCHEPGCVCLRAVEMANIKCLKCDAGNHRKSGLTSL